MKYLIFLVILSAIVLGQVNNPTPDSVNFWCEYSNGDDIYGTGDDLCRLTSQDSDAWLSCGLQRSVHCLVEGELNCTINSSCYCPYQTNPAPTPCNLFGYTLVEDTIFDVQWDLDERFCTCYLGPPDRWDIGGELSVPGNLCCGDDIGAEFYIVTDTNNDGCCDQPDDFVHSDSICEPDTNLALLYGYITGEQSDGSFAPLDDVIVNVRWLDTNLVNWNTSDSSGYYEIHVPRGNNYWVSLLKGMYDSPTVLMDIPNTMRRDFQLMLSTDCRNNCVRRDVYGEYRCDPDCDGINGCQYSSWISDRLNRPAKYLCEGKYPGWTVPHNDTHELECCEGYPVPSYNVPVTLSMGDVKNAQTFYAGSVNYESDGQLYNVYIVIFENN